MESIGTGDDLGGRDEMTGETTGQTTDDGTTDDGTGDGTDDGTTDDGTDDRTSEPVADDVELTVVTMTFEAGPATEAELLGVLARYVVLTRNAPGCRNVDLCASVTRPGRHLIVQKWTSPESQRAHFDSELMVDMARSCTGLLSRPPDIDLWDAASAHDLR